MLLVVQPLVTILATGRTGPVSFVLLAMGLIMVLGVLLFASVGASTTMLVAWVLPNLGFLVLLGWSLGQSLPVRVQVGDGKIAGTVAGIVCELEVDRSPDRRAGLYLQDYRSSRTYQPPGDNPSGLLAGLRDLGKVGYPREGWDTLTIRSGGRSEARSPDWLVTSSRENTGRWYVDELGAASSTGKGLLSFDVTASGKYAIDTALKRPAVAAGIAVGLNEEGDGYLFLVDPERERMSWHRLEGGDPGEILSSAYYRQDFTGGLQSVVRDLALIYVYGLGLSLAALAVCLLVGAALGLAAGRRRVQSNGKDGMKRVAAALRSRRAAGALAGALFLTSTATSSYVALRLLEGIPHVQDEVAYLFQAKTFGLWRISVPAAPYPEFFQNPFILTYGGEWFSKYPPGHALVLVWGVLAGQPWLVGPILGACSLVVVYLIGSELWDRRTGLLAALLGVFSPFLIFMSASYLAHPSAMLFIALFILCYVKVTRRGGWWWGLGAGFFLGMAFITRQLTAVGAAAPFVVFSLLEMRRDWRRTLSGGVSIVIGFVPVLLFLLLYNHLLTGSPLVFPHNLVGSYDSIGFGPGIGGVPEGHTPAQAMWNTQRNLNELMVDLFGWPFYLTLAFIPLTFALGRAGRWDFLMLGGLAGIVVGYVFWWAVALIFGPRYWYEALPFLLLLTSRGLLSLVAFMAQTAGKLVRAGPRWTPQAAAGVTICSVMVVLLYFNLSTYMPEQFQKYYRYNGIDRRPIAAVEKADLHNAVVFFRPDPAISNRGYGPVFSMNSPLLDNDVVFARDLGEEKNRILMTAFPGRRFYLLDGSQLSELDSGR